MQSQRTCPNCGASVNGEQRFCSECGTTIDVEAGRPTVRANEPAHTQYSATPPPPPPTYPSSPGSSPQYNTPGSGSFGNKPSSDSYGRVQQPAEGMYMPPVQPPPQQQPQQLYQAPVPDFARAQPNAGRGVLRGLSCGVLAVVLVILAVLGGLGYGGYLLLSHAGKGSTTSSSKNNNNNNNPTVVTGNTPTVGDNATPTAPPPQTIAFGTDMSLTFATVQLNFTNVEQAQSFPDDGSSNGNASTVRVSFKEANTTSHGVQFSYPDIARLILPDQSSLTPDSYKNLEPPASNATADNWIDFSVPTSVSIASGQLILRMGKVDEQQMDIPLKAGVSLSKYQAKTINSTSAPIMYDGLKWTMTTIERSYSANSKQAEKGHLFVTVSFKIDNPGTSGVSAYWSNYMRMKAGSETSTPEDDTTIPLSIAAGSTGITGYASFAVPDNTTSFTFELLASDSTSTTQPATITFQIS